MLGRRNQQRYWPIKLHQQMRVWMMSRLRPFTKQIALLTAYNFCTTIKTYIHTQNQHRFKPEPLQRTGSFSCWDGCGFGPVTRSISSSILFPLLFRGRGKPRFTLNNFWVLRTFWNIAFQRIRIGCWSILISHDAPMLHPDSPVKGQIGGGKPAKTPGGVSNLGVFWPGTLRLTRGMTNRSLSLPTSTRFVVVCFDPCFFQNNSPYQSPFQALLTHDLIFPALSGNQLVIRSAWMACFTKAAVNPRMQFHVWYGFQSSNGYLLETGYALSFIEGITGFPKFTQQYHIIPIYIHLYRWRYIIAIIRHRFAAFSNQQLRQLFVELARDHSDDPTCKNGRETWATGASMVLDGFVEFCWIKKRVPLNLLANHYPRMGTYHSQTHLENSWNGEERDEKKQTSNMIRCDHCLDMLGIIFRRTQLFVVFLVAKWAQSFRVKRRYINGVRIW